MKIFSSRGTPYLQSGTFKTDRRNYRELLSTLLSYLIYPLVFRHIMSLTSGSGRAKKIRIFSLTKNECAAEIKITEYYAFDTKQAIVTSLYSFSSLPP